MLTLDQQDFPQWGGVPLKLPPKERAVLALLIQRQPQVVSKQEFADGVWGQRHPMSDESLARCISHLRGVLASQSALTHSIESMYGLGYRLKGPATTRTGSSQVADEATVATAQPLARAADALQHAQQLAERRTPAALNVALRLLRDLVAEHPGYAAAHVALAQTMADAAGWGLQVDTSFIPDGLHHLDEAERLDPATPGLLYCRAHLLDFDWRFRQAAPVWQKAMLASTDDPKALFLYGRHLLVIGDTNTAIATLRQAAELHPFSALLRTTLARALAHAGDPEAGLAEVTATCEDHPESEIAASYRIALLALVHPEPSIVAMAWRMAEQRDAAPLALSIVSYALARLGRRDQALEVIDACLSCGSISSCGAVLHTPALLALGEMPRAVALMSAAYKMRCGVLPLALRDPGNISLLAQPEILAITASVFGQVG